MFLHRKPDEEAIFRRIITERGSTLKLTNYHLIYVATTCSSGEKLRLVHAKDLKRDQCVYTATGDQNEGMQGTRIINIEEVGFN